MRPLIVPSSVLLGLGLYLGTACSAFDHLTRACTLRPCGPTLVVQLAAAPAGSVRVEATDAATKEERVFECSTSCEASAWFTDFKPQTVTVRVTTSAGTVERTLQPSYASVRPNGSGCEPVCPEARVSMPLPT